MWGPVRPRRLCVCEASPGLKDSLPSSSSVYPSSLVGCSHPFPWLYIPSTLFYVHPSLRLLTISTWIPLGLRSPSTSNTDSRILSLPIPPHPVYQVSIKDPTFHQVAQASTYSHLPHIFFSPTLHLTHQKILPALPSKHTQNLVMGSRAHRSHLP